MDVSYSVYVCFGCASDSLLLCFECPCLSIWLDTFADLDRKQAQIKPKPALRAVITGRHKSDGPLPFLANLSVEYSASSTSCLNLATSSHHIRTQKTGYQYICISVLLVRWRILLLDVQPARVKTKAVDIHESSPIVRIDDTNGSKNMHNKRFFCISWWWQCFPLLVNCQGWSFGGRFPRRSRVNLDAWTSPHG